MFEYKVGVKFSSRAAWQLTTRHGKFTPEKCCTGTDWTMVSKVKSCPIIHREWWIAVWSVYCRRSRMAVISRASFAWAFSKHINSCWFHRRQVCIQSDYKVSTCNPIIGKIYWEIYSYTLDYRNWRDLSLITNCIIVISPRNFQGSVKKNFFLNNYALRSCVWSEFKPRSSLTCISA